MRTFTAALFALALVGCAGAPTPEPAPEEAAPATTGGEISTGTEDDGDFPPGAPQDCIDRRGIRSVEPVGNHTLLFYMRNGDVWRNRLRSRCIALRRDTIFSYDVQTNRLCSTDIVWTVDRIGSELRRGPSCALGEFDYLTEDQAAALRQYTP